MKIAFDFVATNLASGTKTYIINFCNSLNLINNNHKLVIFLTRNYYNEIDQNIKDNKSLRFIIKSNYLSISLIRFIWMQLVLPIELKLNGIKKLYSPMNISSFLCKFFKIKVILTLHSNLPWKFFNLMPGNIIKKYITKKIMELSISISDVLIVNSFYAKNEIMELLHLNEKKIHVCHLGLDEKFVDDSSNTILIEGIDYNKDYILSVLSCVKYHNIINLLKAYRNLLSKNKLKINYIIVMQKLDNDYFNEIQNFIKKNFLGEKIMILSNLKNYSLIELYKKAKIYIFSSYCEVFGLTTIEAMSQSCPVLVSNTSALPEINNTSAEYFNPDDVGDIENKMLETILNPEKLKLMAAEGLNRSKQFRWNKTVDKTLKIIENL